MNNRAGHTASGEEIRTYSRYAAEATDNKLRKELNQMETVFSETQSQHQRVSEYFDGSENWKGKLYSDRSDRFNKAMVRRMKYAMDMIGTAEGLIVGRSLDIGCGCGIYSKELAERGFIPCGIDVSREMIRECRNIMPAERYSGQFSVGSAEDLPFGSSSFDLVLAVGVFGYLTDDRVALREITRVIKPGGYLFISVQNIMSVSNFDYSLRTQLRRMMNGQGMDASESLPVPWVAHHSHTRMAYKSYFPVKFRHLIEEYGFTAVKQRTHGYELRYAKRSGLFNEAFLEKVEMFFERLAHRFTVPPLLYSGDTYSVLFRKRGMEGNSEL